MDVLNNNKNVKCVLFKFGNVDLHFSIYYNIFVKKTEFDIKNTVKQYIQFINEIECNNCNKIVFAVYPSVIKDIHFYGNLLNYGIVSKKTIDSFDVSIKNELCKYSERYKLYSSFNYYIKKYCDIYNITFINLKKYLLNEDNTVKQKFINPISYYSIHLLYEPLIPIILKEVNMCNIKQKYKYDFNYSYKKYVTNKKKLIKQI